MHYCPEVAILHGTFALVERESKTGKFDLFHHTKGFRDSQPFLLIKDVIQEIISGPEKDRSQQEQETWSRRLHKIFFCKVFVFNKHILLKCDNEEELSEAVLSFKAVCAPLPDFHPHLYFELSDEFGWSEFLGEVLVTLDSSTSLHFISQFLKFCIPEPALLYDLSVISVVMDFLISVCFVEVSHQPGTESFPFQVRKPDRKIKHIEQNVNDDVSETAWIPEQMHKIHSKENLEAAVNKTDDEEVGLKQVGSVYQHQVVKDEEVIDQLPEKRQKEAIDQTALFQGKVVNQLNEAAQQKTVHVRYEKKEAIAPDLSYEKKQEEARSLMMENGQEQTVELITNQRQSMVTYQPFEGKQETAEESQELADLCQEDNQGPIETCEKRQDENDLLEEREGKTFDKQCKERKDTDNQLTESNQNATNKSEAMTTEQPLQAIPENAELHRERRGKEAQKPEEKSQMTGWIDDQQLRDRLAQTVHLMTELLAVVEKRMSTKLFDRDSCKSCPVSNVLHILSHILASVLMFSVISFSSTPGQQLRDFLLNLLSQSEVDFDEHHLEKPSDNTDTAVAACDSEHAPSICENNESVNLVAETLLNSAREAHTRMMCIRCLCSFFTMPLVKGGSAAKLSIEKSVKFGRILRLKLNFCKISKPLTTVKVICGFIELFTGYFENETDSKVIELKACLTALLNEIQVRQKCLEKKERNPSLAEVMEKVRKRLPMWKWCLQYGLAKRNLKKWWFAGFLELLYKDPQVLDRESDIRHLLSVLAEMIHSAEPDSRISQNMCAELILNTFSLLPSSTQETIILDVYKDRKLSTLPLIQNFDEMLMVTFNKLTADTNTKDLQTTVQLALEDPLMFVQHAVNTAMSNKGQIPVIIKILQLMPSVMRAVHQEHHPDCTLLCHCLHSVLFDHSLDPTEQKNILNFISSLVQSYITDVQHPPLLSPSEFLSKSVLPFISVQQTSESPVTVEFALRCLVSCLDATLVVGYSDWLEDVHPVVIVACCGTVLHGCVELTATTGCEVDWLLKVKPLVVTVLEQIYKHFTAAGKNIEACKHSLGWLQDKCLAYDWTVSVYLAAFLMPNSKLEKNLVVTEFTTEAIKRASLNPVMLLHLSAISDEAAAQVMQGVQQSPELFIQEAAILQALLEVMPHLLAAEVKRLVEVLLVLVKTGCVDITSRWLTLPAMSNLIDDICAEMLVSQMLMDSTILFISHHFNAWPAVLQLVSQVLVVAMQVLLQNSNNPVWSTQPSAFNLLMFYHICIIMSAVPNITMDPLFVILLDILARVSQKASSANLPEWNHISDCLVQAIDLIPQKNLQDTLYKKLEHQIPGI